MRVVVYLVLIALFNISLANHLGSISVTFRDEDPHTGNTVDATIGLGDSLEVTLTLNPAPLLPIRFDVVSTIPDIIKVSHPTITFNRGQTQGTITVESPPDGKIGVATIIVTPEKPGLYAPITFDILVQGTLTIGLVNPNDCVGVSVPSMFVITVSPPSPETVEISLSAVNGELISNEIQIPLGHDSVAFQFVGDSIGASSISVSTPLYNSAAVSFDTLGTIVTSGPASLIQNAPSNIAVSVIPEDPTDLPNIFISSSNAVVTPSTFTLSASGTSIIEVVPIFAGGAAVTYSANDYCPHTDIFDVAEDILCSAGFIPNIAGDVCVECPGNDEVNPSMHCLNNGNCGFSKCFDDAATCFCFFPYVGSACQFDTSMDMHFDTALLTSNQIKLTLDNLPNTVDTTKFLAPGNLISPNYQVGRAVVAGYYPDDLFYNAVNPSMNPPSGSIFSGIGWYWENTCFDNTIIHDDFLTAPVSVQIEVIPEAFTSMQFLQVDLYVYDSENMMWVSSIDACTDAGFDSSITIDLYDMTLITSFCKPGQYAIFVVPNNNQVPNTGNTNPPNPSLDQQSGTTPGTGRTGWQPPPPLPRAVEEDLSAYEPSNGQYESSSASVLSMTLALVFAVLVIM